MTCNNIFFDKSLVVPCIMMKYSWAPHTSQCTQAPIQYLGSKKAVEHLSVTVPLWGIGYTWPHISMSICYILLLRRRQKHYPSYVDWLSTRNEEPLSGSSGEDSIKVCLSFHLLPCTGLLLHHSPNAKLHIYHHSLHTLTTTTIFSFFLIWR